MKKSKLFRALWHVKVKDSKKLCEFCGTELEPENRVLTTEPPQYPYFCPTCGAHYVYTDDGRRYFLSKYGNRGYRD